MVISFCFLHQVTKKMLTLATQLHHGYPLCLAELILANLYESINNGVTTLNNVGDKASLLLSGPFWLLQLWINATFESLYSKEIKLCKCPLDSAIPLLRSR